MFFARNTSSGYLGCLFNLTYKSCMLGVQYIKAVELDRYDWGNWIYMVIQLQELRVLEQPEKIKVVIQGEIDVEGWGEEGILASIRGMLEEGRNSTQPLRVCLRKISKND